VSGSPPVVTLSYSEPVEPLFSSVRVTDAAGARLDDGKPWTQDGGRMLCVSVKHLPSGAYNVDWHVTSVDTHKTEGHFSFTVKP
jgi:methionine-rich copper-binding protein CopC